MAVQQRIKTSLQLKKAEEEVLETSTEQHPKSTCQNFWQVSIWKTLMKLRNKMKRI